MIRVVAAYAPANISCIFGIVRGEDAAHTGSVGMGFTLSEGVIARVSKSDKTETFFNGKLVDFPTTASVVAKLTKHQVKVTLESPLPLGSGFGLSGASALATAYALNNLFDLGRQPMELAKAAHIAEVECGTGLGDVTNQYLGGVLIRRSPSFEFEAQRLPIAGAAVYCVSYGLLDTKSVITNDEIKRRINKAALTAMNRLEHLNIQRKSKLFPKIVQTANEFASDSGLLIDERVAKAIRDIEAMGGAASMIMLGKGVFSTIPFDGATKYFISEEKAHLL